MSLQREMLLILRVRRRRSAMISRESYDGMERNGTEWNGMERNGTEWIGTEWIGTAWTGLDWTGLDWNELKGQRSRRMG